MRAADGSGDTLGLQEKAPSRGMQYLVNIINKTSRCHKKHIHHHLVRIHLKQGRTEKRRHQTHPWIYGSCVGAWRGLFSAWQYATADGCRGQRPGNRRKHDRVNTTTCMPGTYDKKSSSTKRPCSFPPKFIVTYGADRKSSVYTF